MPVQINEMVIRANIREPSEAPSAAPPTSTGDINKEELVRECAALVIEMLNAKNQR